ncbi:MAG: PAS domain-containing protein [Deltaproteobacteria bacterium]|nr:PAS domain-containing protein [Deltaproteobacteria bacterium]
MTARDLGSVLEAIVAGVIVLDRDGRVEEINSAASRIVERSREQALGRPVEDLVTPSHAFARLVRKTLSQGSGFTESHQKVERRNLEDAVVDVAATPLFAEGELDGVVLVLRDRTARNRLEQLEEERERFETFGQIAAGLAHEIKNPLGGIRGAGEILGRRSSDAKNREISELVVREATRIASLVDDFMVFARGDRLDLVPLNVHRVLDHVLELAGMDPAFSGAHVERNFDPSIPELLADGDRLTQVFLNLIRNGLQALGQDGGTITITTRVALERRLVTDLGHSRPTLVISIEDDGAGMDAEELRQATVPFFTTRTGGTGLGLAVAEYWTAQHEGTLDIESEKGVGTRVRVALPLVPAPTERSPE